MAHVPGPSLDQLDALGDDYATLLAQALAWVTRDVDLGTTPFPEDVGSEVRTLWAEQVSASLLPALGVGFEVGAAQVRVGIREALGLTAAGRTYTATEVDRGIDTDHLTAAAFADVPPLQDALAEAYLAQARNRLVGVGDELWAVIREQLLEGMRLGEGIDELAARLVESAGLTEARAAVVARTEVLGATNAGAIAQVRATGLKASKEWLAAHDQRVRDEHEHADGQVVGLDEHFTVGGFPADRPHDPSLPPHLSVNCRCALSFQIDLSTREPEPEGEPQGGPGPSVAHQRDRTFLERVFSKGLSWVARWLGRQGGPQTASAETGDDLEPDGHRQPLSLSPAEDRPAQAGPRAGPGRPSASSAEVQSVASGGAGEVAGGDEAGRGDDVGERRARPSAGRGVTAAAEAPSGAMVALVPSEADLDRLVLDVEGAEPREELHLTLWFLGDASEVDQEVREAAVNAFRSMIKGRMIGPVMGVAFAADWFNPAGDEPCWVLGVGDDPGRVSASSRSPSSLSLSEVRESMREALFDGMVPLEMPRQHSPWVPHVALGYSADPSLAAVVAERVGPITFDRLRVAFGEAVTDLPLGTIPQSESGGADMTAAATVDTPSPVPSDGAWEGVLVVEGTPTGDGRQFAQGALTWAELPLPLKWQESEAPGHDGAVIVGRIDEITREGNQLIGRGVFDLDGENGREAHRLVSGRFLRGVSIQPDDISDSDVELVFPEGPEAEGDDLAELFAMPELMIFHAGRVRSATLCAEAAFVEAEVRLTGEAEALAATAHVITIPDIPPAEWFEEPTEAPPFGAIEITDEGRIYGYVAPWNVGHRGFPERVTAPRGHTTYKEFHEPRDTGRYMNPPVLVERDGKVERIKAGCLTLAGGHASTHGLDWLETVKHYDDSESVVARVRVGENDTGLWVAGYVLPDVTAAQIQRMMACQLSGDWRPHKEKPGWYDFAAALFVPVPGFPMAASARVSMRFCDGQLVASAVPVRHAACACPAPELVAAGREVAAEGTPQADPARPSLESVKARLAASVGLDLISRRDALAARVKAGV